MKFKIPSFQKGDFVQFDGLPAVVVGVSGDPGVPEDHLALWFGEPNIQRKSQGGPGNITPQIWTVPEELCLISPEPAFNH